MTPARDQQIRALYQAALERPPTERASFVAALTGDDAELRKSVELLLSSQGETDVGARVAAASEPAAELAAGTTFGQYHIDGVLGRGGIGVVYLATDTKLHRPVAIKFLSAAVADADVRRRFKQEAETTSSLNHPHIVTVYDVGDHDGREYIVSELVDGGTLDEWAVKTRKRSWRQSVELLTGVADALAAAHAAGVLHRDVKPGNILIGSNGYAKLADFGLAKLVDDGPSSSAQRANARSAANNTRAGVVVGTIAYMSPEQAAGLALDARSDVFSFGVVLYELIAGRRPFDGANDLETLKSIAHAAPAPLPDDTPDLLKIALDKALEKEPSDRYQTMQDFVADLKRVMRRPAVSLLTAKTAGRARASWLLAAGVALGAALAVAAFVLLRAPPVRPTQVRFTIAVPGYRLGALSISPDGQRITYASEASGKRELWIRPVDSLAARAVPGTDDAAGAFWSPDSRYIAFITENKLKKIDAAGGPTQTIADQVAVAVAGSWNRDGTILVDGLGDFSRVPSSGGTLTQVVGREASVFFRGLPRALPDGKRFIYLSAEASETGAVLALRSSPFENPTSTLIGRLGPVTAQVPTSVVANLAYEGGFLLMNYSGALTARPFDPVTLVLGDDSVLVAENVAEFALSPTGVLVYREASGEIARGPQVQRKQLVWFDRSGQRAGQIAAPAGARLAAVAPDAGRVAVAIPGANGRENVWMIDTARNTTARLTFSDAEDGAPIWSRDGTQIVFNSGRNANPELPSALYRRAANGAGTDELLLAGEAQELLVPTDWTADGVIVFTRMTLATWRQRSDIWTLQTKGEKAAAPLFQSPIRKGSGRVSPNSRWIAYDTYESGDAQVVVEPFPKVGQGKWQVSTSGGGAHAPRWRADGRELYYMATNGDIMAVAVDTTREVFESGPPHKLFGTGMSTEVLPNQTPDVLFDVTGDGERFLVNLPLTESAQTTSAQELPLNVVVNWTAGLAKH